MDLPQRRAKAIDGAFERDAVTLVGVIIGVIDGEGRELRNPQFARP
jgi:hypothetical protein